LIEEEQLIKEDVPLWLTQARLLPGWDPASERSLIAWQERRAFSDDDLEDSVNGLNAVAKKTFVRYKSLAAALQRRVRMGWDKPQSQGSNYRRPQRIEARDRDAFKAANGKEW